MARTGISAEGDVTDAGDDLARGEPRGSKR